MSSIFEKNDKMDIISIAKQVFKIEAEEILNVSERINSSFENIVSCVLECKGKLVLTGIGKSGIVARKISSTLSSTGTPSFYIHPGEAYHGDLGMISENDIVVLISNSGETDEILKLIPFLKEQGNVFIAMCGNENSNLAKNSNYFMDIKVSKEACPLQLAPTSSSTVALVMGDALAVALMKKRGFKDENFARLHPGGALGRKLLLKVNDVMRKVDLPIVSELDNAKKVIQEITKGKAGLVSVITGGKIVGIITDGDIRRTMESKEQVFFSLQAQDIMTKEPKIIHCKSKLIDASKVMNSTKVGSLLVNDDEGKFVGIIQMFDINL